MGGTKKLEAEITTNKNNRHFEGKKKTGATLKHVCFICTLFVIEMSISIPFRIHCVLFSLLSFLISCVNYNEEKMIMQLCK